MTWLKADTACWQKGEELFSGGYNMTLPLILESFKPENYWIGLRRHFVLKWINGSDVAGPDIRIRGGFCLAAYKSSDNLITVIAVDCSIPLSFACEITLYILLGILGGMLIITAIIVLTIFKYRSGRFARRRVYEDTLRRHSEDRLTVHNQDDEFISVDNSAYRPSS
nr:hypothetical protein BaRGS_024785 [Batillaria attramentaria]